MKKSIILTTLAICGILAGCNKPDNNPGGEDAITELRLDVTLLDLYKNESHKIGIITTPEGAEVSNLVWSSSDSTIVTVSEDGLVAAVGNGIATVTAIVGELEDTCDITVDGVFIDMREQDKDAVRSFIADYLEDGEVNFKLAGEFAKLGISDTGNILNEQWTTNPFFRSNVEKIDMTEVTDWPFVDVDGMMTNDYKWAVEEIRGLPAVTFYGYFEEQYSFPMLTEVLLSREVKALGSQSLWNNPALENVVCPGVTDLGNQVFCFNTSLKTLELPNVTKVYTYAFMGSGITSLNLAGATELQYGTFDDCTSLTELILSAPGDITLTTFPYFNYYPFNFNTIYCNLTLNADKHYESGTASPKASDPYRWSTNGDGEPLIWANISYVE